MPTQTTHYKLIKPLQDEYYNIDDFNRNADAIDAALHDAAGKAEAAVTGLPSLRQQFWKAAGTYTFTAPRTTRYIVECVGGGGGCAHYNSTTGGGTTGGGGAYTRSVIDLAAGQNVTVTVGAAGEVVSGPEAGTAGGASSFGGYATANGGAVNATVLSPNNLPSSGDIRLPGFPAYADMASMSSYATGFTGSSFYGTPSVFNFGDTNMARIGQHGAGAGVGAANLLATGVNRPATPGMVIVTYLG